jgi:general secretion pathway protein J
MGLNRQQGFTLLEILIALAIFAIMSMMAYAGLASMLDAHATTEPRSKQMAQLQATWYLFNEDLSQAINRPIRDELGSQEPAFSTGRGNELLVFTRNVPQWSSYGENNLQRVSYRFENGVLSRQVWTLPDRTQQTQYRRRKLLNAEQVDVKYYDEESQIWLPFTGSKGALPNAIEISFKLADLGVVRRSFLIHQ